ncbi:MAG: hypothetical protein D6696_19225 [Acidobacteria bacterium]|nr:MAG: hypothetical protein D6696_19225 [Acidobacteriota bacterium]
MKARFLPLLLLPLASSLAFAATAGADETTTAQSPPAAENELTLEQVIAKNLEARGGREALKAVQSVRMTGTLRSPVGGFEGPLTVELKRPKKMHFELDIQGTKVINAYDGETGWYVMPMMTGSDAPQKMAEDQLKQAIDQADFDGPLVDWREKGLEVELLGKDELEGTPVYKIRVTDAAGDSRTLYLDAEYFLELREDSVLTAQGNEINVTTVLGDYKEVGDLMMAHSIEQHFNGNHVSTVTFEHIELNPEIPDEHFAMPAVEEKPVEDPDPTPEPQG